MMTKRVLLVGETWISASIHIKGYDQFTGATFQSGAGPLKAALAGSRFELTQMPAHEAVESFPFTLDGLASYDAIILSDIGANSLLLPPDVAIHSKRMPNRLRLLEDWTLRGGALLMMGGYLSFQGMDGKARWRRTPVENALPVDCLPYDDRIEVPEGFIPEVLLPDHPILSAIEGPWPYLLGANEVLLKDRPEIAVIARLPLELGGHPLLVTGRHGAGRTLVWTSDIGPHWLPPDFVAWPGYATLWRNALAWATDKP